MKGNPVPHRGLTGFTGQKMENITTFSDGSKIWERSFSRFKATVYIPTTDLPQDYVNYGFRAPYLLIFEEKPMNFDEAKEYADANNFTKIASAYASSVVFITPINSQTWETADSALFSEIITNSKINQYFENGAIQMKNRFTGEFIGEFIRGAIFRTNLFAKGAAADYIARNLLTTTIGDGLWGRADICPVVCTLENLSIIPKPDRRDIPIISIGNSDEINASLKASCDYLVINDKANYYEDYFKFSRRFKRMVGTLEDVSPAEEIGLVEEPGVLEVKTSPDNMGDDKGTERHKIGYMAFYNKGLFANNAKVPLVLGFHGGGDSIYFLAETAGWEMIAHKYNFLLVNIENHLNSTATEMMELIAHLKTRYNIDTERIYASGFSMGGCKSWDLFQEYPSVFAALAPMDATFDHGCNSYGQKSPSFNTDTPVPVFYAGGEITPLPELPFQAEKCYDRMKYVMGINKTKTKYDIRFEDKDNWADKIWGISGDRIVKVDDPSRGSVLTMNLFENENGCCYNVFSCISGQGHECRPHTCEHAWLYMSQFRRLADGSIAGGKIDDIEKVLSK